MIVKYFNNMVHFKDLSGQTINQIYFIEPSHQENKGRLLWLARCHCGQLFGARPAHVRDGTQKSCGCSFKISGKKNILIAVAQKVKNADMTGKFIGKIELLYQTGKCSGRQKIYKAKCFCGTIFEVTLGTLRTGRTGSCGCRKREAARQLCLSRVGPKNPRWNPEITDEKRYRDRTDAKAKAWRTAVFERDEYTCRKCGKKDGGRLNAHHLDGWHWCKEKRYDQENGVCMCIKCHKQFHKIYGQKNVTEQQFNEWINEKEAA